MVLAGHSMGAFVAVHAAHDRPDLFSHVVLVDGGVALPFPDGADPDEVLDRTLGPAIDRLGRTYPSVDAYVDVFRQHPAMAPTWDDDDGGLRPVRHARDRRRRAPPGRGRTRCGPTAATCCVSGSEYEPEVRSTTLPVQILAAPYGMFGQPGGLLPVDRLAAYDDVDHVAVETVPDVNHYTILFAPHATARVAAAMVREAA